MRRLRNIIEIDQELCNGCGQCILDCAEGALKLVEGKARLVGEIYCDGLGACLGGCPTGALTVIQREAEEFDEQAVEELLAQDSPAAAAKEPDALPEALPNLACGCPGSQDRELGGAGPQTAAVGKAPASGLGHWPVQLQLLNPQAPYLRHADLLLLADCAALAYTGLHTELLPGRAVALACPKLEDARAHEEKLAQLLAGARPRSLTVVRMEVPCCKGLVAIAQGALAKAGLDLEVQEMVISAQGKVLQDGRAGAAPAACACAG